ncbi:hypothetical protein GCM10009642_26140 [Nocardiopsis metallicus]
MRSPSPLEWVARRMSGLSPEGPQVSRGFRKAWVLDPAPATPVTGRIRSPDGRGRGRCPGPVPGAARSGGRAVRRPHGRASADPTSLLAALTAILRVGEHPDPGG